jgi:hypothetical protein
MLPGELKPVLTALVMPPAAPLLIALLGILVAGRRRGAGLLLTTAGVVLAWMLSTNYHSAIRDIDDCIALNMEVRRVINACCSVRDR